MGNICNRLSHAYAPTYKGANISYSMQKRLLFKIGYVCKIPYLRGGYDHLADSLIIEN